MLPQAKHSKAILLETLTILGAFKDGIVIVGGWVPELYLQNRGHIGSVDVDLALDPRKLPPHVYDTLWKRLKEKDIKRNLSIHPIFSCANKME